MGGGILTLLEESLRSGQKMRHRDETKEQGNQGCLILNRAGDRDPTSGQQTDALRDGAGGLPHGVEDDQPHARSYGQEGLAGQKPC